MNPIQLLAPSNPLGNPAPFWFLELFKILGFTLHLVPMNLWYAGIILIVILGIFGKGNTKIAANHLANSMPIIIALGINFGIIPLLFTQVAYYKFYYTSSILMAWPWLGVIGLLIFAYYGMYIYTIKLRSGNVTALARICAWISMICFILIGFLFTNNMSLMTNADRWVEIFRGSNIAGAATGLALNLSEPTFVPRWLMMLGIACTTVGAYIAVDGAYFSRKESGEYHAFAPKFGILIYLIGIVVYAGMGSWYFFGTLPQTIVTSIMNAAELKILVASTALFPIVVLLFMIAQTRILKKYMAALIGASQFVFLGLNAISRQWVQNYEASRYFDVSGETVHIQWSPMIVFLILFVAGVSIVIWMIAKAVQASSKTAAA